MQSDDSAAIFWTAVWHKLLNSGEIVIPKVKSVTGVLLLVERHSEWNGLLDNV